MLSTSQSTKSNGYNLPEDRALLPDCKPEDDVESAEATIPEETVMKRKSFYDFWLPLVEIMMCIIFFGSLISTATCFHMRQISQTLQRGGLQFSSGPPATVCLTSDCVVAASKIIQNLSPNYRNIDPCDDFRAYACEGFDLTHDLREDQSNLFTGVIMAEDSERLLRNLLESPYSNILSKLGRSSSADEENFDKLRDSYDACMDESRIRDLASAPLLDLLRRIEELFPAERPSEALWHSSFSSGKEQKALVHDTKDQLTDVVAYMMNVGVTAMLSMGPEADDKDPDTVVVQVGAPYRPGLPSKQYYKDRKLVQKYSRTIGQVLEALLREAGPDSAVLANWRNDNDFLAGFSSLNNDLVDALVEFESKLAEASPDTEDAQDVTKSYNPRTVDEVDVLLPQLSIPSLIATKNPEYIPKSIIVGSPSYLEALSSLLKASNKETIQAYLVWKTVQSYADKIEDDAVRPLKRFNNELQGKDPDVTEERWRTCVRHVDRGLGWILSRFYVAKAFSEDAKNLGNTVVSDIKEQFIKKLHGSEWMTEEVRELGIEKVKNIVQKIGYPTKNPDIRNATALQQYYSNVDISDSKYFANSLSVAISDTKREWAKLGKPTDRSEWGMTADTVNAYYNPPGNEILFPAGIMQSPLFYDSRVPLYLTYGAFGSVSGHELSHAFDSTGRHYDQRGNYTEWWDPATIEAFKKKAECFVDEYHNFTVPGPDNEPLHVNGRLTLGENIADAGGLSAAFAAWRQREEELPTELLPGLLDFSKEQLFFLSSSSFWCGKTRKEEAIRRIYLDPHAPSFARIIGPMANSREFRESFRCAQREPTCEMW